MSAAKHTPGPWAVNHAGDHTGITEVFVYAPNCGVDDVSVAADIVDPVTSMPSEANARLIASAPDLLEALEAIEYALRMNFSPATILDEGSPIREGIRAAIARATGTA